MHRIRAVYRDGHFIPHAPCPLPDDTEVKLLIEENGKIDGDAKCVLMEQLVKRIAVNPVPGEAPRLRRDDLYDRA